MLYSNRSLRMGKVSYPCRSIQCSTAFIVLFWLRRLQCRRHLRNVVGYVTQQRGVARFVFAVEHVRSGPASVLNHALWSSIAACCPSRHQLLFSQVLEWIFGDPNIFESNFSFVMLLLLLLLLLLILNWPFFSSHSSLCQVPRDLSEVDFLRAKCPCNVHPFHGVETLFWWA